MKCKPSSPPGGTPRSAFNGFLCVSFIRKGVYYTNSEQNLFFWMDSRRAAHFFLFPLYLYLSPRFQPVMGGRKRKRKDKE
ncbi:MAG: hypothetical protein LBI02_02995 [Opitutaceae bacterium]|jgi:hypothetical protein|nr:hypothetical protein [Opitutaceae bacterium]